ncbi:MAG: DEAD/DEAH box helicase [Elusimicrobia bacterium]|nr:DEAD/DEAH box helicase [Elusimicrobiota bacterium]
MAYKEPTPIQAQALPPALAGQDVLGSAMTGSGKTLAFVLPLLQKLILSRRERPAAASPKGRVTEHPVRALVLVPTRELAAQVERAVRELTKFSQARCVLIIGGASFHEQLQALRKGADIVVATPGRLLDHYGRRQIRLDTLEVAVLDEADRMLDMGFMPDIRRIMQALPKQRQTMMFSATIPPEVARVVGEFMREPVRISIDADNTPATGIRQALYPINSGEKFELLHFILKKTQVKSAVIFTRTRSRANQVARFLELRGVKVAALHSDKTQAQRDLAMEGFRQQKHQILVATDIAARGLDVRHISHVINFDVPLHPEDYVHRVGRTGRVFATGDAITLMGLDEERFVAAIERLIGAPIPRLAFPEFPYKVPPQMKAYKQPAMQRFKFRRRIARSSSHRFRRR